MSDEPAVTLGAAVRRMMDAAVLTQAGADVVTSVTKELDALTEQLIGDGTRAAMPWPDPQSMRRGYRPFSPVIGAANPIAPPLEIRVCDDSSVLGEVTMRPIHEGPPGVVHGGWVASLLDQLLGHANAAAGVGGFTAELTVRYRRPTPYDVPLVLRARTDRVDGRSVYASGEIVVDGHVTAEATGLFRMPTGERLARVTADFERRQS